MKPIIFSVKHKFTDILLEIYKNAHFNDFYKCQSRAVIGMGVRGSRYEGSDESDNGTVEVNQNDSIHTHKVKADHNGVLQQPSSINEVVGPSVQVPPVTEDDGNVSVTDFKASHMMFDVRLVNTGSKKMREASLKMNRFPETVRELKEALEEELQIPTYDQVVIFGSEQLDDKKKIEFYRIKDGDLITVKYTSAFDIKTFRLLLKDLTNAKNFLKDVQGELSLEKSSPDFRQRLSLQLHVSDIAQRVKDLDKSRSSPYHVVNRWTLGEFLIRSEGLPLIDELHSILVRIPLSTICHVDLLLLERSILRMLWNATIALSYLQQRDAFINFDNVIRSFCRVRVAEGPITPPANRCVSKASIIEHVIFIVYYSLSALLE